MDFIIADRQELTALALGDLVRGIPGARAVPVPGCRELVAALGDRGQCVVILDFPRFDFRDAAHLIITCQRFPHAAFLLLGEELSSAFLRDALYQVGNISVAFKDDPVDTIREALGSCAAGRRFLSPRVAGIIAAGRVGAPGGTAALTRTEVEITRALAAGLSTKEIAAARCLSVHTVGTHRKNIFRKLGVNTAHEAVRVAIRSGIVDESDYFI
ncbi:MAG: response regulator transcription factor [Succinivibrionaceae bacterium]|nr:response regulator transcription factor [Succinivibrionaceae bacterium]